MLRTGSGNVSRAVFIGYAGQADPEIPAYSV
jgi:hypothetical protein